MGRRVASHLAAAGHEVYAVGGCVRDLLLGRPVHDVDLATAADPDTVERLAADAGFTAVAVGKAFGVIIVVDDGEQVEVATFRSDGAYIDGRRPTSIHAADAATDVERRDFTINALLLDLTTATIIDHVGGLEDLEARRLRTVGDPARRFAEDRLRVLRALRFAAHLDLAVDPATWAALGGVDLGGLAQERILQEWAKALSQTGRSRWWDLGRRSGCLDRWLPRRDEVLQDRTGAALAALDGLGPQPLAGIQALCLAGGAQARAWLVAQPLSKDQVRSLVWFLDGIEGDVPAWDEARRWRFFQRGVVTDLAVVATAWEASRGDLPWKAWAADPRAQASWAPCLSAADLLSRGWSPGRDLGRVLRAVADAELAGRVPDRAQALALAASLR